MEKELEQMDTLKYEKSVIAIVLGLLIINVLVLGLMTVENNNLKKELHQSKNTIVDLEGRIDELYAERMLYTNDFIEMRKDENGSTNIK